MVPGYQWAPVREVWGSRILGPKVYIMASSISDSVVENSMM